MGFSPKTINRAWIATIQIQNMKNAGLTEEKYKDPEYVATFFTSTWENSGKDRTAAISVCVSKDGRYHAHMALYGNSTTLKKVASILFDSHVEPQLGGKDQLKEYILKKGKYEEKGEIILFSSGIENMMDINLRRYILKLE